MSKFNRLLLFLLSLFILTGCATTQQYLPPPSRSEIDPQQARIVIKRTNELGGSGCNYEIQDNETPIGTVSIGGELIWDRKPGKMRLSAIKKSPLCGGDDFFSRDYKVTAGGIYTFEVSIPRDNFTLLSGTEASNKYVLESVPSLPYKISQDEGTISERKGYNKPPKIVITMPEMDRGINIV